MFNWLKQATGAIGNLFNQGSRYVGNTFNNANRQRQQWQQQVQRQAPQVQRQVQQQFQQVQRQIPKPPPTPQVDFSAVIANLQKLRSQPQVQRMAQAANPVNQFKQQANALQKQVINPLNQFGQNQVNRAMGGIKVAQNANQQALQNPIVKTALNVPFSNPVSAYNALSNPRKTFNDTRGAREMFFGKTGELANTVKSLPAGINVLALAPYEIAGQKLGIKPLEQRAKKLRLQQYADYAKQSQQGINPVGSQQQRDIDAGGVKGLKAFTGTMLNKGAGAGLEIAPVVTGYAGTVPLKTALLKGGTLGAGGNLAYSGITGQYGGNRSAQEKALQFVADVGGGYGGELLGVGLNRLTGKGAKTIQQGKSYTGNMLDEMNTKFRQGKIDEKQFRAFVIDDFTKKNGRMPMPADVDSFVDVATGRMNRPYVEAIRQKYAGNQAQLPVGTRIADTAPKNPLDDLLNEARKYKSAEEFVNSYGEPVYHGSRSSDITEFNLDNLNATYMKDGLGINFTNDRSFAELYRRPKNQWGELASKDDGGGKVYKRYIKATNPLDLTASNRKVSDIVSLEQFKKIAKDGSEIKGEGRKYLERIGRSELTTATNDSRVVAKRVSEMTDDQLLEILYGTIKNKNAVGLDAGLESIFRESMFNYKLTESGKKELVESFRKHTGFDAFKTPKENGNYVITTIDPSNIKTKQQLTDLYNQATKNKPIYELAPKPSKTPEMPDDIKRISDRIDNGELVGRAQYAKVMEWQKNPTAPVKAPKPDAQVKASGDQVSLGDITPSTKPTKTSGIGKVEEGKTMLLNRFEPVEQFVRNKQKEIGRALKPSENPTYYVKEFLGGGGIANAKIDNELTPIIRQTKDFDSLRQYLIAQRTNELADRGISPKRADDALNELRLKVGDEQFNNFDNVANQLYEYQKKQLSQLVDVGVLTKQQFDNIVSKNQKYIPFNRVLPDGIQQFSQGGSKISSPKMPIKAIKGSDLEIVDPIESMIKNTYDIQATVQKQKVLNSLYNLAPDEFKVLKGGTLKTPAIEMFQNGKRVKLAADQDLARALNSMDEENLNFAVRALSLPARTLRSGATGLNVGFVIPNVIRDQLSAAVNSKYGGVPIYDFLSGLASTIRKDDSYKKWILSGADQASFFAQDRKTLQRGVSDVTGNKLAKAGKFVKNPLEVFRIMGEFSEKGSRVGVFKRAVRGAQREGLTGEDVTLAAMRESREATIDFAQRGAKMKAINAMTPFLNARLQGSYKMIQSFKQRPVQTAAIGMAYAGAPAAALYIWNTQGENKKTYDEIPDYIKRENFVIVTGNKEVPFIKVPKGEIGKIFGNTTESLLASIRKDDTNWTETANAIADSFLPVGSISEPARFITDTMPTAASVPMQLLANYDAFRDRNIVGQYQKDLPAEAQSNRYTTETAKKIGGILGISPAKLEFGISGFTGGLGRQGLQLADALTGTKIPVQEMPVASRFLGEQKDLRNSADDIYAATEKQKAETARENYKIKEALKKGDESKLTGDKERDNRLKRSVEEEKIKDNLTPKQKALFDMSNEKLEEMGGDDAKDILALKKSLSSSKSAPKNPRERYQQAIDDYNEKLKNNELSGVGRIKAQKEIATLEAKANFSQDVVDLYSFNKDALYDYLTNDPNGGNTYQQLLALDDELVKRGGTSKFRDKYGNLKSLYGSTKKGKTAKGKKGRKAKVAKLPSIRLSAPRKVAVAKVAKLRAPRVKYQRLAKSSKTPKIKV